MTDVRELCRIAEESGLRLLADLDQARTATDEWSDLELSDQLVAGAMNDCLDRLSATDCWGDENRTPSNELWRVAGTILRVGALQNQARQKPRGYAGDFEMLHRICDHWVCSHPLGRSFDRFFQSQAAPQAVRNRTKIVADQMAHAVREAIARGVEVVRIASVGSGPAIDIEQGLQQLDRTQRERVEVVLLDMDPESLEFAVRRLSRLLSADQLHPHRENLFRLPRIRRVQQLLCRASFITCTGLFDYLDEESAITMLSCFYESLAPGGQTIVFNFSPANSSRAYMEWIGNWYLTYRTQDDLTEIVGRAIGDQANVTTSPEDSHASLFVMCTKT